MLLLEEEGQKSLLEYLRNLTPQVLLASTALLIGHSLDFGRWDWHNWFLTTAFYLCVVVVLTAFGANLSQFLDRILSLHPLGPYQRLARSLRSRGVSKTRTSTGVLWTMFRRRPTLFLDFLASVAITNLGLLAIAIAALNSAKAALRR